MINSVASRLIDRIPRGLRITHELVDTLYAGGTKINKKSDSILFNHTINNKTFIIQLKKNSSDSYVFQQIMRNDEYGIIVDFFMNNNISVLNIVDAGANIGLTTMFLKAHFPNARIIALEPSDNTYNRLNSNMQNNSLEQVTCLKKGLWSHSAFLSPDHTFRDGLDWSFRLTENHDGKNGTFAVISMNDLISEYNLEQIDFLKVDIEGGEVSVFGEHADLGWLTRVKVIAIEIHDEFNCRTAIENKLSASGFTLSYSGELTIGINNKLVKQPARMESVKSMGIKMRHPVPVTHSGDPA